MSIHYIVLLSILIYFDILLSITQWSGPNNSVIREISPVLNQGKLWLQNGETKTKNKIYL